jgi:hypothetical protein
MESCEPQGDCDRRTTADPGENSFLTNKTYRSPGRPIENGIVSFEPKLFIFSFINPVPLSRKERFAEEIVAHGSCNFVRESL